MLCSKMVKNAHLAGSKAFDVHLKDAGLQNLLTMRFDALPRPEKGVCHFQALARTSVTVDAPQFGQIWLRSAIRAEDRLLTDRATRKHLPVQFKPAKNHY